MLDYRAFLNNAAFHHNRIAHHGTALNNDVTAKDGTSNRSTNAATCRNGGVAYLRANLKLCWSGIVSLCLNRALWGKELICWYGVQKFHIGKIVRVV